MTVYEVQVEGVFFKHPGMAGRSLGFIATLYEVASSADEAAAKFRPQLSRVIDSKGLQPNAEGLFRSRISIEGVSEVALPPHEGAPPPLGFVFYDIGISARASIAFDLLVRKNTWEDWPTHVD